MSSQRILMLIHGVEGSWAWNGSSVFQSILTEVMYTGCKTVMGLRVSVVGMKSAGPFSCYSHAEHFSTPRSPAPSLIASPGRPSLWLPLGNNERAEAEVEWCQDTCSPLPPRSCICPARLGPLLQRLLSLGSTATNAFVWSC